MRLKKIRNDGSWAYWAKGEWIYICQCSYYDKDIPKQAGFRWHGDRYKVWWTHEDRIAAKLADYADASCRGLESLKKQMFRSEHLSRKASGDFNPPHPDGLDYFPFQKVGIECALLMMGAIECR